VLLWGLDFVYNLAVDYAFPDTVERRRKKGASSQLVVVVSIVQSSCPPASCLRAAQVVMACVPWPVAVVSLGGRDRP
jgi:hypothetical protein